MTKESVPRGRVTERGRISVVWLHSVVVVFVLRQCLMYRRVGLNSQSVAEDDPTLLIFLQLPNSGVPGMCHHT